MTNSVSVAALGVILALAGTVSHSAAPAVLAFREQFFHHLTPDMDRDKIEKAVGKPDITYRGQRAYQMQKGAVVLRFESGQLIECRHLDPAGGGEWQSTYYRMGGVPSRAVLVRRDALLRQRRFDHLSRWGLGDVRADNLGGVAYLLNAGYLVLEAMAHGSSGVFSDRIAKATLHQHGRATVFFRAFDRWGDLRPKGLTRRELDRRERVLARYGRAVTQETPLHEIGKADDRMGSGLDYRLYYLREGLLIIIPAHGLSRKDPGFARLWQPGALRQSSLEEWLLRKRPGRAGGK